MPVDEGQEPEGPYGTYDPTAFRPKIQDGLYAEDGSPLPKFDDRYAEDFDGLVFLGALLHTFEWLGHTYVIRTLGTDDLLAVAQVMRPWQGTIGEPRAYATALVAAMIVTVDGKDELPIPVSDGKGEYAWAHQRFNYIKANWFPFVIDKVYSEFRALETKVEAVVAAMEKASGPVALTGGLNAASAGPSDRDFSPVEG